MTVRFRAALALFVVGGAVPGAAQQPNASTAAFGMAGNFTAAARNYDAVAWNPANLALPGNSVAAFDIGSLGGVAGIEPVDLRMLARFNNVTIPADTKEAWLQLIGAGTERGRTNGTASIFAMSVRNVAFQVGTSGYGDANLNRDAAEVLLFGNAGRTGTPRDFNFAGSSASGALFTTAAASVGFPLPITLTSSPDEIVTLGVTGKYVIGNAMARAEDAGSTLTSSSVAIAFPVVYGNEFDLGHGAGMDIGLAWHSGRMSVGVAVQNVVNSFRYDTTKLRARLGTASFDGNTSATSFSDTAYALAPGSLRSAVAAQRFTPTIGGGVAVQAAEMLLLTADAHVHTGDGIVLGPRAQVGAGMELSAISFLPLRVGAAKITDGWQAAGGVGLRLGENHIGVSALMQERSSARSMGAMVSLLAFY